MKIPDHEVGDHVLIVPLENVKAHVVEIVKTIEEGWIYVCRYLDNSEAKIMRCFPDEVMATQPYRVHAAFGGEKTPSAEMNGRFDADGEGR